MLDHLASSTGSRHGSERALAIAFRNGRVAQQALFELAIVVPVRLAFCLVINVEASRIRPTSLLGNPFLGTCRDSVSLSLQQAGEDRLQLGETGDLPLLRIDTLVHVIQEISALDLLVLECRPVRRQVGSGIVAILDVSRAFAGRRASLASESRLLVGPRRGRRLRRRISSGLLALQQSDKSA